MVRKAAKKNEPETLDSLQVERVKFDAALGVAGKAIDAKDPSNPGGMMRLTAGDSTLTLEGVEYGALTMRATVKVEGAHRFDVLVPHATVAAAIVRYSADMIVLSTPGESTLRLRAGGSTFDLRTLLGAEYKAPPKVDGDPVAHMSAAEFVKLLDAGSYAPCEDVTRAHIAGVLLEFGDGSLRVIATTDGHRMAVGTSLRGSACPSAPSQQALVTARGVKLMREAVEKSGAEYVTLVLGAQYVHLVADTITCSVRLVDSVFPPWRGVVPYGVRPHMITLNREVLVNALKRLRVIEAVEKGTLVRWSADGFKASARNATRGDGYEEIPGESITESPAVYCSAKYLLDAVTHIDEDEIVLACGNEGLDPISIALSDGTLVAVVMPMRM